MVLPVFAIALAVSSLATVYSAVQATQAQKAQAKYQANVARNNAVIAEQNARAQMDAGRAEADRQRIKNAQIIGAARAKQAASGFLAGDPFVDSGLTSDILIDDLVVGGQLDVLTIEHNTRAKVREDRIRASNFGYEAANFRAQAKSISPLRSGIVAGAQAAAQGISSAYSAGLIK